jgi:molybdate transport system ATP-binding protein
MDRTLTFDVVRRYPRGATVHAAASLPLDDGPVTVLFGVSGSGKTTVLRALAGLERPDAGTIVFDGETWVDAARRVHVPPQRRHVGLVSQEPALFPHLTVAANVGYGLSALPRPERDARVRAAAERVHLPAALLSRRPSELSGGQRQRVALARALAPGPRLLLLDEPLSALDAPARDALRGELRRFLEASGVPALLVTHDRLEALALGDRIAVMAGGAIRQVGPVAEVFAAPADVEVARVVGTENVWPVRVERRSEGLAVVRAAGAVELVAVDPGDLGDDAWACVRAEEIVLEDAPGAPTSARNLLPGTVLSRSDEGPLVRVAVDCGPRVVSLVTRASAARLGLQPGRRVAALVKAPAVRLVPRPGETA